MQHIALDEFTTSKLLDMNKDRTPELGKCNNVEPTESLIPHLFQPTEEL